MTKKENKKQDENLNPIIIDRPEKLRLARKTAEWSATTFGWAVWFFFCRPLFITFLWFLGVEAFYIHMIRLQGFKSVIVFFGSYASVILSVFTVALVWNMYNKIRYGRETKRKATPAVTPEELDWSFKMKEGSAAKLQIWKEVRVDFSSDYHLEFHPVGSVGPPLKGQYRRVRFKYQRTKEE